MAVKVRTVRGGTNSYQTPPEDFNWLVNQGITDGVIGTIANATPDTGSFAVQAQSTPDMTVKVKSGTLIMAATPTSESERKFGVELTADSNVTIASNSSGSTKYDKVIVVLPAATLRNPPADGDFTEAATLTTERHNAASEAVTTANAYELAEVTVINGAASIANTDIADKRENAILKNFLFPFKRARSSGTNTAFGNSYTTVESVSITLDVASILVVYGGCDVRVGDTTFRTYGIRLASNDGSSDTTQSAQPLNIGSDQSNLRRHLSIMEIFTLAAGTYTLKLQAINNTDATSVTSDNSVITALALPNPAA